MLQTRRSFLTGLGSLLAAPAIVRADNLMRCRGVIVPQTPNIQLHQYINSDISGSRMYRIPFRWERVQWESISANDWRLTIDRAINNAGSEAK